MRRVTLALILLPLLAVGCGSSSTGGTTTSTAPGDNTAKPVDTRTAATPEAQTTPGQSPKKESSSDAGRFTGRRANYYKTAKQWCERLVVA